MFSPHIFRANDIRGKYKKDFDLSFTKELAYALCRLAQAKKIRRPKFLVGMDARLSSLEISRSLVRHLKAQGAGVTFTGLSPSPLCYFLLWHYKLTACIVVTASHNPPEFNGFKILFHKKHKIFNSIQKLKSILLKAKKPYKKVFPEKGFDFKIEKEKPYISLIKKEFSLKPLAIALDTGNGALGPLAKKVYSALGLKPVYLFNKPDGHFPNHHPDPLVEKNLSHLKKTVKKKNLKLGFAFDGDGDRLVLVTDKGETVLPDEFGYLFLKSLAQPRKRKKPLVLADVKCSDWFFKAGRKEAVKILMKPSGHGLMRTELEKEKALLALEFSGHIFFNDRNSWNSDDALYASLRLLEILNKSKKTLQALLPKSPYVQTGETRLNMSKPKLSKKLNQVKAYLKQRKESWTSMDGIRLSRKTSWALFRDSKTQEALTMRFSAKSEKDLKKLKAEFSKVMNLKLT